jgi:hypothetical protein
VAFGVGIALFVFAAVVIIAAARSSITSTPVLIGCIVLAAALMSVYAVANFLDPSHIDTPGSSCENERAFTEDWLGARGEIDRDQPRLRDLARHVERCGLVRGDMGADVRRLLGAPDRKAGDNANRLWVYTLGTEIYDPRTLRIQFRSGHAVSVKTAEPR